MELNFFYDVCTGIYVFMWGHRYVHVEVKGQPGPLLLRCCPPCVLRQESLIDLRIADEIRLGWLASKRENLALFLL